MRGSPVYVFPKLKKKSSFIAESNRLITFFVKQNSELTTLSFLHPLFLQARKGKKKSQRLMLVPVYTYTTNQSLGLHNIKINWAEVGSCHYRSGCSE